MAALGWEGWYCIVVILVGVGFMARDIVAPDLAMMGMLIVMMLPGDRVLTIDKALAGFSNEGLLTVGSACREPLVLCVAPPLLCLGSDRSVGNVIAFTYAVG